MDFPTILNGPHVDPFADQYVDRIKKLIAKYELEHGVKPTFIAVAPGRVNLIGEHIDYMGYSVLPMAIQRDVCVAAGACWSSSSSDAPGKDSALRFYISNSEAKYETRTWFGVDDFASDAAASSPPHWTDYVMSGVRGYLESISAMGTLKSESRTGLSFSFCVDGTVPAGSGLSSSSALVCASVLAAMACWHHTMIAPIGDSGWKVGSSCVLERAALAKLSASSERYVGMEGGGMDQAISFLGRAGEACRIDFNPKLVAHPVKLPEGFSFVIAHSLQQSLKAATAGYNHRVSECRFGVALIWHGVQRDYADVLGPHPSAWPHSLYELEQCVAGPLGLKADDLISHLADRYISKSKYTKESIASELGMSVSDLEAQFMQRKSGNGLLTQETEFSVYERIVHVWNEADRVREFHRLTQVFTTDPAKSDETVNALGSLMNASHDSCRFLYECSCPRLDEMVSWCRNHGALGARLTGAGWGGCIVALVNNSHVQEFLEALKNELYPTGTEGLSSVVFASYPADGARIVVL